MMTGVWKMHLIELPSKLSTQILSTSKKHLSFSKLIGALSSSMEALDLLSWFFGIPISLNSHFSSLFFYNMVMCAHGHRCAHKTWTSSSPSWQPMWLQCPTWPPLETLTQTTHFWTYIYTQHEGYKLSHGQLGSWLMKGYLLDRGAGWTLSTFWLQSIHWLGRLVMCGLGLGPKLRLGLSLGGLQLFGEDFQMLCIVSVMSMLSLYAPKLVISHLSHASQQNNPSGWTITSGYRERLRTHSHIPVSTGIGPLGWCMISVSSNHRSVLLSALSNQHG